MVEGVMIMANQSRMPVLLSIKSPSCVQQLVQKQSMWYVVHVILPSGVYIVSNVVIVMICCTNCVSHFPSVQVFLHCADFLYKVYIYVNQNK